MGISSLDATEQSIFNNNESDEEGIRSNNGDNDGSIRPSLFDNEELPEAYPVGNNLYPISSPFPAVPPLQQQPGVVPVVREEDTTIEQNPTPTPTPRHHHHHYRRNNNESCTRCFNWKLFTGIVIIIFISVNISSIYLLLTLLHQPSPQLQDNERNITGNISQPQQPTILASSGFSSETSNETITESQENEHENTTSSSFKCFLDPWEIYMFEEVAFREGFDPSIPRTYQICPNSHLKIKFYDYQLDRYDENSGDYDAFILFRPNVSIKCGKDGSFDNNCTLSGGLHHVFLLSVSVFEMHKILDTSTENVTFEGFRFTEARGGTNIMNFAYNTDITFKNCHFTHNYEMFTSIMSAPPITLTSTLTLLNCTFEHNTYKFYHVHLNRPNIGVIASFPINNTNAIVNTHISNTVFRNNTFLLDNEPEIILQWLKNDFAPEDVFVNGAIVNLMPAWGVLEITDSCFVFNKGYTNSLIIMDKDNRTVVQNSHGNYFGENEPRDVDELSCILLYQNISYVDGWPMDVLDVENQSCSDNVTGFVNTGEASNNDAMCLF